MRNFRSVTALTAALVLGGGALGLSAPSAGSAPAAPERAQRTAQGTGQRTAQGTAEVSAFHAIPGVTVDVYVNGRELLSDVAPGTLTSPRSLPSGSYDVELFRAGADPAGTPLVEKGVRVRAGSNTTLVAHLTAAGDPTLDSYTNDVSRVPAGQTRTTVRHVAAAPAVDVKADRKTLVSGLTNPGEATGTLPAGTAELRVLLAGTGRTVLGPTPVALRAGTSTVVYVWGSAAEGNLALKTQVLGG
ncbi:DUF4397 domain-containing protein [Streptomyces zingiberis]|uniref:DUF4397 domain-containing protein n=1 Tax=Streptomyces zingiberis TaxID=2053010 RepID=A0ABX1BS08_9ACTN|nr:DUF4397 domain-containing protein [Streptomyces zingiberis]NJP99329.1 DUF4397 domain-containing protein [Streptomyces zingiberis]